MSTINSIGSNKPIEVAFGGTGDSSLTAYAVLCGGTTSTNPVQSIASVGTSGQVLKSNGAAALPTFADGSTISLGTTNHAVQVGNSSGTLTSLTVGTNGQVLVGSSAADPVFATLTSSSLTYTTGAGSLAINITAPVSIANGGTNATSMSTSTGIVKYDGTRLVTSTTAKIDSSNRMTNSSQPAFMAYLSASVANVTGDQTAYQLICDTVVFDQASNYNNTTGVFTAPVTGVYQFNVMVLANNVTASFTTMQVQVVTTTLNLQLAYINPGVAFTAGGFIGGNGSTMAKMTAGDTCVFKIVVSGGTKSVGVNGPVTGNTFTYVSGYLVA